MENVTLFTLSLQLTSTPYELGVFDVGTLTGKIIQSSLLNLGFFSLGQNKIIIKISAIGMSRCNLLKCCQGTLLMCSTILVTENHFEFLFNFFFITRHSVLVNTEEWLLIA